MAESDAVMLVVARRVDTRVAEPLAVASAVAHAADLAVAAAMVVADTGNLR
jgi:hypothetical protein